MDLPFDVDDEPGPEPSSTMASSILIVDDEPIVLDVLQRLLAGEADLDIATAESAELALQLMAGRFDLLVTDKNLPKESGIELIAGCRAGCTRASRRS